VALAATFLACVLEVSGILDGTATPEADVYRGFLSASEKCRDNTLNSATTNTFQFHYPLSSKHWTLYRDSC
jgi:hypothetical protein